LGLLAGLAAAGVGGLHVELTAIAIGAFACAGAADDELSERHIGSCDLEVACGRLYGGDFEVSLAGAAYQKIEG
jgi:hypothetical protein